MITRELIEAVRGQFALDWQGIHGIRHWARVFANGTRLAAGTSGNLKVVQLFALFHDSCRLSEGSDPGHGPRGAQLAHRLHGHLFNLANDELVLLEEACTNHTVRIHHDDPTIALCFDADRLDLGRVGSRPDPNFLNTAQAQEQRTIEWATQRSVSDHLPENILADFLGD